VAIRSRPRAKHLDPLLSRDCIAADDRLRDNTGVVRSGAATRRSWPRGQRVGRFARSHPATHRGAATLYRPSGCTRRSPRSRERTGPVGNGVPQVGKPWPWAKAPVVTAEMRHLQGITFGRTVPTSRRVTTATPAGLDLCGAGAVKGLWARAHGQAGAVCCGATGCSSRVGPQGLGHHPKGTVRRALAGGGCRDGADGRERCAPRPARSVNGSMRSTT
jgi:hypothetical protein